MKPLLILLMATSAFLCGCDTMSPTTPPMHADKAGMKDHAAIRELLEENITAFNAGNPSTLARYYEKDAVQFPPNAPALTGWEAIRSTLERELKGVKVTATIEVVEIFTARRWAFTRCTYRMVTTAPGGGQPTVVTGNWLNILRRQPDNSWKIARSFWSSEEQPDVTRPLPASRPKGS